jgi:hypothetical protein
MAAQANLDQLWNSAHPTGEVFDPGELSSLPKSARDYLLHAIAPGTPLASAVRLRMHGEIKLGDWCPFTAEEVINAERGMIWQAAARMSGFSIRGADSFVDETGESYWKLFGMIPVATARGPDVTLSAAGRAKIESIWLPSLLCQNNITWTTPESGHALARFVAHGEGAELDLQVAENGALQSVSMTRWGNPDKGPFRYHRFGGIIEAEREFAGYTIPVSVRVGWHFNGVEFQEGGEFFHATIDDAAYR